jgi:hypothetical protein
LIKRLSWALALSVGLNLFLLGFGAARVWRGRAGHRPALMRLLGPPTPALRAQRDELNAARRRVGDALEAEPFDRERAERALVDLRASAARGQELLHQRLLERAAQMTREQRRKLAEQRYTGER